MNSYKKVNPKKQTDLLQRRTKELQALVRVAQLINTIDLDYILLQTLQLTTEVAGASKGSFFLLDTFQKPIQRFITQRDLPPEMTREVARHVVERGLAGWCIRHKQGAIVEDIESDERWYKFPDDEQEDVHSALCVPVTYENLIHGVMTLVHPDVGHFDDYDLELVGAIANQASTAIRNAQLFDAIEVKQSQLELVLQNNSEGLLTVDSNFMIQLINPAARNVFSTPPTEDIVGKKLDELSDTSVYPEIVTRIRNAPEGTNVLTFQLRDNTQKRDFVISVSALKSERDPTMQGYVIVIHDFTSIKAFDRLRTSMLHMLTHDLKNPMNVIWGYVDLLRIDSQQNLPADQRFVDGILRALQRMENLIDETLSAERLMATGQEQINERFLPDKIIRESIDGMLDLATKKNQELIEDIQAELPFIQGAAFQIREAMSNLISNAIKYTPPKGQIIIHASREDERFKFYVEDTGMGIPQELQSKLFNEFYRAQRPEMQGIEGTGLGLSLVKNAIERHHGQVWFESTAGKGSTFGFWLPVAKPNSET